MPNRAGRSLIVVVLAASWLAAATASAADPAATCAAAKRKAAAKKAKGKLGCAAKAAAKGLAIDGACLGGVETKFQTAYAKAESKGGCLTTGNANAVETTVDGCVGDVQAALAVPGGTLPQSACLAAKLKAAGKKIGRKVGCTVKALKKGVPVDPTCLTGAEVKFDAAMTKAAAKGDCVQSGDTASTEAAVDQCLDDLVGDEPGPATTTTTGPPTTTTTVTTTTTTSTTTTTTTTTSTTTTTLVCNTESATFSGITAQHNATRAGATPAPNPPLDPLCWSNQVAGDAQAWADNCDFSHDPTLLALEEGQNIYAAAVSGGGFPPTAAQDAEPAWASEAPDYDYNTNSCSSICGHYTQIVWRSTAYFGCGIKDCTTNSPFGPSFPNWTIVVCNYAPPGNAIGQQPY